MEELDPTRLGKPLDVKVIGVGTKRNEKFHVQI